MSVFAHVEKVYSLEGTIGSREIIMEIRNVDGYYNGRYCFRDKKKSIYLDVKYDSITCTFKLLRSDLETKKQESIEQIVITEDSLHNWSGEQKTSDGRIQEVFLHPIKVIQSEPHAINNEEIKKVLSPYNYSLLSDIKYKSTSFQKFKKGIKIEWLTETCSQIKSFRFVEGFSDSTMNKINNYLEQFFINDILNGYSYENYETEINISYVSPSVLSMVESIKTTISNTKATASFMYLTLDLKNIKRLNLEDLLWLGEGTPPRNESREYFKYRVEVFEKKIKKYVYDSYAKEISNSKCNYSNEKAFRYPDFYLSKQGIVLMLNHYELSDECKKQTWAVLRYNDFPNKWNEEYF